MNKEFLDQLLAVKNYESMTDEDRAVIDKAHDLLAERGTDRGLAYELSIQISNLERMIERDATFAGNMGYGGGIMQTFRHELLDTLEYLMRVYDRKDE